MRGRSRARPPGIPGPSPVLTEDPGGQQRDGVGHERVPVQSVAELVEVHEQGLGHRTVREPDGAVPGGGPLRPSGERGAIREKGPSPPRADPEKRAGQRATFESFAVDDEPPWESRAEDAIGLVGAGRDRHGVMRVGGEWMGSSDVDHVIGEADPALFGVQAETLVSVIARARGTGSE